jgi:nucleoside 2-deoxyribosyltransferase
MIIAICGSIKFYNEMVDVQHKLEKLGHEVLMPNKAEGVDYWAKDNKSRVEAKKKFRFIDEHLDKIEKSDAVLIVNITKKDVVNYIGANTFLEMGFAYYRKKKIFTLNPLPDQPFIVDELLTFEPIVLNGHLEDIK